MPHILVIDDHPEVCAVVHRGLQESGYRVSSVAAADAARPIVDGDRPDLIVLDAVLPDRSGIEVAADASQRGIPVILMTGEICASEGLNACGWRHLYKPFRLDELLAEVRAVLVGAEEQVAMVRVSLQRLRDSPGEHRGAFDRLRESLLEGREWRRERDAQTAR